MANTIRIKRRATGGAGAPTSLENAELAFNEVDDVLYYGKGTGGAGGTATTIEAIGGKGAYVDLSSNQTVGGTKTFSSTISGSVSGNAGTVTNGVYTTGSYANPTWITSLAGSKISGNIAGNAANVTGTVAVLNGGTGSTTAGGARTNLGATTVGSNFFTLTNPGAITFPRINADNTVSALTASAFRTAIGAGAGDGTVTSVSVVSANGLAGTVATATSTPAITLSTTVTGLLKGNGTAISAASAGTDYLAPFGSQTANTVYAAPNGSAGAPTFRALVAADIPTLTAAKISDFDTQVRTSRLDQMAAPTSSVSLNSQKITNIATPTADTDAANKGYVDSVAQGLDPKQSVHVASTANIETLSGLLTIDGVTLVAGDRVLVKNQSTAAQNGIYVAASTAWSRSADFNDWAEVPNAFVFVEEGSTQADTGWVCTSNQGGTIGTTAITWTQFSGAGTYIAGAGLTLTGNTFAVGGTTNRITVNADTVDIASTYVGQTSITTLGTIGTGTWNATTIALAKGGTGATTAAGARTNLGATTVGSNLFTLTNPGAITFIRLNADSTATARSAADFRTDLGLGTMATQNANNVAITGGTIDGITIDGGTF
jgi:hypothetical protein